jgi:DNA-binding NarL/FixJ family response regulator
MKTPDRIVIVDNNPASSADFRTALEAQPDLTLAAAVTCASCSFAAVSGQQPDLVLVSLSMPGHRVLELVKDLLVLHASLKFLIVSSHGLELEAGHVLRAGAHGCVLSSSSISTKLDAMRQVLAGRHCFSPQTAPRQPATASLSPLHWVNATTAL